MAEKHSGLRTPDISLVQRFASEGQTFFSILNICVTDIFMPEKYGLEAIRELRALRSDVKIIAITGFPVGQRQGYLELAEDMGAARTFTKPFDTRALVEAVHELVAG